MKTYHCEHNYGFNPEVVRNLLLDISITSETGDRFGVPAARLERWLQELAHRLDVEHRTTARTRLPIALNSRRLNAGEIHTLLDGFETPDTPDG